MQKDRETEADIQTQADRNIQIQTDNDRQAETDIQTQTGRESDRERDRQSQTDRDAQEECDRWELDHGAPHGNNKQTSVCRRSEHIWKRRASFGETDRQTQTGRARETYRSRHTESDR